MGTLGALSPAGTTRRFLQSASRKVRSGRTLPTRQGPGGSLEGEGTYRQAHQVTRPGSRLRFSAPRASCLGPGAGPRSVGRRSRDRHRIGCSGTSRSPPKSARSQLLQGPRRHRVGAGLALAPRPLNEAMVSGSGGPGRCRSRREDGLGGSPCLSWMWPLPLACAILLLSMGPGGSGTDTRRLSASGPLQQQEETPGPSSQQVRGILKARLQHPRLRRSCLGARRVGVRGCVQCHVLPGAGARAPDAHSGKSESQRDEQHPWISGTWGLVSDPVGSSCQALSTLPKTSWDPQAPGPGAGHRHRGRNSPGESWQEVWPRPTSGEGVGCSFQSPFSIGAKPDGLRQHEGDLRGPRDLAAWYRLDGNEVPPLLSLGPGQSLCPEKANVPFPEPTGLSRQTLPGLQAPVWEPKRGPKGGEGGCRQARA